MNLNDIQFAEILPIMRTGLQEYVPNHARIDYAGLFEISRRRAFKLWNAHISPELDVTRQRQFERALVKVNMRAGISIPQVFALGHAFGAACHHLAGGDPDAREEVAVTTGLYLFVIGTLDHLLDEHLEEFAGMDRVLSAEALERAVVQRDVEGLRHPDAGKVLANGLLQLYRLYFKRCHCLLDRCPDAAIPGQWLESLRVLHKLEHESVERRMSKVVPTLDLIPHIERASTNAFWCLALSACLAEGGANAAKVRSLAENYGRLTWYADDVADLEADVKNDIWSGFGLHLALHARTEADVERVVRELAEAGGGIVTDLYRQLGDVRIEPDDPFTLADVLWVYVWAWVGGGRNFPPQGLPTGAVGRMQAVPIA